MKKIASPSPSVFFGLFLSVPLPAPFDLNNTPKDEAFTLGEALINERLMTEKGALVKTAQGLILKRLFEAANDGQTTY